MAEIPDVQNLVSRLSARGKKRLTIVGAVMRKLLLSAFAVLKHKLPFDPDYLVIVLPTA